MGILRCFKDVNKEIAEEYHTIDFKEARKWWVNLFKNILITAVLVVVLIISVGIGVTISRGLGFGSGGVLDFFIVMPISGVGILADIYLLLVYARCRQLKEGL